jgi:hypothetical protein
MKTRAPLICIATCAAVPNLDQDGPLLIEALESAGCVVGIRAWDDANVDWQRYDLVLVRSTWDYTQRLSQFLDWTRRCRRIVNASPMLVWNTDKRYLSELARAGVPIVPTLFLSRGDAFVAPNDWREIVVKPNVSASAKDTGRFRPGNPDIGALIETIHAGGRVAMIQPYLSQIETRGETSLIFLAGKYSHAIRKEALLRNEGLGKPMVGDDVGSLVHRTDPSTAEFETARKVLKAIPRALGDAAYARVDLIPDANDKPLLLELELVEPSFFLKNAPSVAIAHFANYLATLPRQADAG